MNTLKWPNKDPEDVVYYGVEWAARLGDDEIVDSLWIVPDGLTQGAASVSGTLTMVWLSGGVAGRGYKVVSRITTTAGEVINQGVTIGVFES